MWLVLAQHWDGTAWWAWRGLAARGLAPIEFVSVDELTTGTRWVHTVGLSGAGFEARLPRGQLLRSDDIDGVLNRIGFVPPSAVAALDMGDREYASQELGAFFLSWLFSIRGPVLNRPTARGLAGAWRSPVEWSWLAGQCGLPSTPYPSGSEVDGSRPPPDASLLAIVIGDHVVGDELPDDLRAGCRRLARQADTPVLGIWFERRPFGGPVFARADLLPPLERGGDSSLDALAKTLQDGPPW